MIYVFESSALTVLGWLWGLCVIIWSSAGISYLYIFELSSKQVSTSTDALSEAASCPPLPRGIHTILQGVYVSFPLVSRETPPRYAMTHMAPITSVGALPRRAGRIWCRRRVRGRCYPTIYMLDAIRGLPWRKRRVCRKDDVTTHLSCPNSTAMTRPADDPPLPGLVVLVFNAVFHPSARWASPRTLQRTPRPAGESHASCVSYSICFLVTPRLSWPTA